MYGKLVTVRITPEIEKRKAEKMTTWAHLIERGLVSLERDKDYGIEITLLNAKIERMSAKLDEQIKKNWELEKALQQYILLK